MMHITLLSNCYKHDDASYTACLFGHNSYDMQPVNLWLSGLCGTSGHTGISFVRRAGMSTDMHRQGDIS